MRAAVAPLLFVWPAGNCDRPGGNCDGRACAPACTADMPIPVASSATHTKLVLGRTIKYWTADMTTGFPTNAILDPLVAGYSRYAKV